MHIVALTFNSKKESLLKEELKKSLALITLIFIVISGILDKQLG
tara:strand:+ start:224 stop:355 length:132 start_codon:yes stop_codon:yes gene_type:complete